MEDSRELVKQLGARAQVQREARADNNPAWDADLHERSLMAIEQRNDEISDLAAACARKDALLRRVCDDDSDGLLDRAMALIRIHEPFRGRELLGEYDSFLSAIDAELSNPKTAEQEARELAEWLYHRTGFGRDIVIGNRFDGDGDAIDALTAAILEHMGK